MTGEEWGWDSPHESQVTEDDILGNLAFNGVSATGITKACVKSSLTSESIIKIRWGKTNVEREKK